MKNFRIEIDPELPELPNPGNSSMYNFDAGKAFSRDCRQYDIVYHVGGRAFRYYPANIVTVFNDLLEELTLIRSRNSHDLTLSGYTVLQMEFASESVIFLDPLMFRSPREERLIGMPVWILAVEEEFRSSVDRVLNYIKTMLLED